jgi:hypothetical protein
MTESSYFSFAFANGLVPRTDAVAAHHFRASLLRFRMPEGSGASSFSADSLKTAANESASSEGVQTAVIQ